MHDTGINRNGTIARRTLEVLVVAAIGIALAYVLWPRSQTTPLGASENASPEMTQAAVAQGSTRPSPQATIAVPSPTPVRPSPTEAVPSPTDTLEPAATGYAVTIDQALNLNWTAADAASAAATFIAATQDRVGQEVKPIQLISVEAMAGKNEPEFLGGPDPEIPAVWVVHSYGTFINDHGPVQYLYDEGWFIYDDHDGSMLGEALQGPVGTP